MLSLNLTVIQLIVSIVVACCSFYGLKRYINKHTKKLNNPTFQNLNNPAFNNPINPQLQMFAPQLPISMESVKFDKVIERTLINNLLNSRASITLELPEDTEIELLGKKWRVKAGSKIRISSPTSRRKPAASPLDRFLLKGGKTK